MNQNKTQQEQERVEPDTLWHDHTIEPEQLIQLDPLEITHEMVQQAQQPELADYNIASLPTRAFTRRTQKQERDREDESETRQRLATLLGQTRIPA